MRSNPACCLNNNSLKMNPCCAIRPVRISGVVTATRYRAISPKRYMPCGKGQRHCCVPSIVIFRGKRRSSNRRRQRMKPWPHAMKKSSRESQTSSKNGMNQSARLRRSSRVPGLTDASSTVATRENGSRRSAHGRRKRRAVISFRTRWRNSHSVSWLSGPKPTALCLNISCLWQLKLCWRSP